MVAEEVGQAKLLRVMGCADCAGEVGQDKLADQTGEAGQDKMQGVLGWTKREEEDQDEQFPDNSIGVECL